MKDTAYIVSQAVILETAQHVFNVGTGLKDLNMNNFMLSKILKVVQRIEAKVDLMLDTPLKLAIEHLKTVVNMLEAKHNLEACKYLEKMMDQAMLAFEYAQKSQTRKDLHNAIFGNVHTFWK